jgi:hypothetical protein
VELVVCLVLVEMVHCNVRVDGQDFLLRIGRWRRPRVEDLVHSAPVDPGSVRIGPVAVLLVELAELRDNAVGNLGAVLEEGEPTLGADHAARVCEHERDLKKKKENREFNLNNVGKPRNDKSTDRKHIEGNLSGVKCTFFEEQLISIQILCWSRRWPRICMSLS